MTPHNRFLCDSESVERPPQQPQPVSFCETAILSALQDTKVCAVFALHSNMAAPYTAIAELTISDTTLRRILKLSHFISAHEFYETCVDVVSQRFDDLRVARRNAYPRRITERFDQGLFIYSGEHPNVLLDNSDIISVSNAHMNVNRFGRVYLTCVDARNFSVLSSFSFTTAHLLSHIWHAV